MLAVVDIGNSYVKIGVFIDSQLVKKYIFQIEDFKISILQVKNDFKKLKNIYLVSVISDLEEIMIYLSEFYNVRCFDKQKDNLLKVDYETPETLGNDRLILSNGARLYYPNKNCLTIALGTCVIYDLVDKNGVYQGGSISPGLMMRYKALNAFTSKLPLLNFDSSFSIPSKSTSESIHSGVFQGMLYEIEGQIVNYSKKFKDLTVILTGGDTNFFADKLNYPIFADENFLLKSLNALYQKLNHD